MKKYSPVEIFNFVFSIQGRHRDILEFEISQEIHSLSSIFDILNAHKKELGISHYSLSQTTLEQVRLILCAQYDNSHRKLNKFTK